MMDAVHQLPEPTDTTRRRRPDIALVREAARSWPRSAWFERRARTSRRSLVDEATPAEVMLTSYGTRLERVHLVVESIGAARIRPRRLTLTVDSEAFAADPPEPIRRQLERGLTLQLVPDWGPHKKYLPRVLEPLDPEVPLVTADDDVFYPRWWLERLVAAHFTHPRDVIAHRAHRIDLVEGHVAPYATWTPAAPGVASPLHLATGVGGVLHPPVMLAALRSVGATFPDELRRVDDVWLHLVALRAGLAVRQVDPRPGLFASVPGLGHQALVGENVAGGGNDRAIAVAYHDDDRAALREAGWMENPTTRPTDR